MPKKRREKRANENALLIFLQARPRKDEKTRKKGKRDLVSAHLVALTDYSGAVEWKSHSLRVEISFIPFTRVNCGNGG